MMNEVFGIFHRHAQGRLQSENIAPSAAPAQQHPLLPAFLHDLLGQVHSGFLALLIFDYFDADHETCSSRVAHHLAVVLDPLQF